MLLQVDFITNDEFVSLYSDYILILTFILSSISSLNKKDTTQTLQCDANDGWMTTAITDMTGLVNLQKDSYHEFANLTRTWCVKAYKTSFGGDDLCIWEGANRITFGQGRTEFAAAFIHRLSQNAGK